MGGKGVDATPHVGMPNRVNNLEETTFTNVGLVLILFLVHHFESDPICMWHGPLFKQFPFAYCTEA
jgi:hypothetical protein